MATSSKTENPLQNEKNWTYKQQLKRFFRSDKLEFELKAIVKSEIQFEYILPNFSKLAIWIVIYLDIDQFKKDVTVYLDSYNICDEHDELSLGLSQKIRECWN